MNEKGHNKKKREQRKIERLRRFLDIDLCACCGGHQLQCQGVCRESHINPKTGMVECGEMYRIDRSIVKPSGLRRSRRDKKDDYQKDRNDNSHAKQQRREKMLRDRS